MTETLLEEVRRAMAEADCLATPAQVDAAYDQLARQITERLQHANPLIYTVMNGGLIVAGAFTFLPGRLLWEVFFG